MTVFQSKNIPYNYTIKLLMHLTDGHSGDTLPAKDLLEIPRALAHVCVRVCARLTAFAFDMPVCYP